MPKMSEFQKWFYFYLITAIVIALLYMISVDLGSFVVTTAGTIILSCGGVAIASIWFEDRGRNRFESFIPTIAIGNFLPMVFAATFNIIDPREGNVMSLLIGFGCSVTLAVLVFFRRKEDEEFFARRRTADATEG